MSVLRATAEGQRHQSLGLKYTNYAVLLGYLYVCYLLAAVLDEAASLLEHAPDPYIADPGTADLRTAIALVPATLPYFWFLTNEPPLWHRYNHCIHHEAKVDVAAWGGYEHVPFERVAFDQHIYSHLKTAYGFWNSASL